MSYQIEIRSIPAQPLAVVRRRASSAEFGKVVPEACGTAWSLLRAANIKGGRLVAVYLDDQTHLEIGAEVDAPIAEAGELVNSSLPAGEVATTVHFGPYQKLGAAHDAIHAWAKQNGRELLRPCWEVYGHWLPEWNENPSLIRTDIFYRLKTR